MVWFFAMYFLFFSETLSSKVNLYTDNLVENLLAQIVALTVPFAVYIVLMLVFKIFLWIANGFRGTDATMRVKIFAGDGSFFNLIKKNRILVLGIVITLILIGIFISFTFTVYNSYERKYEVQKQNMLKFDFMRSD